MQKPVVLLSSLLHIPSTCEGDEENWCGAGESISPYASLMESSVVGVSV